MTAPVQPIKYTCVLWIFLMVAVFAPSCNTIKPFYGKEFRDWQSYRLPDSTELIHTVYLAGDGGDMTADNLIIPAMNRQMVREPDSASSVVFLGDNIYLHGLPDEEDDNRHEKEEIILEQMKVADEYHGNVLFVPGNHDWDYSGPEGLKFALNQERFVEKNFEGANVFRPDNGCAGPELINVNPEVALIAVNSEWWIHPHEVPQAPENGCRTADKTDFMIRLEAMVRANADRHILIVAHHPIISNGNHGGHYNLMDNIFPLRLVRDNLYIPLPLIGSIYPLARKMGVSPQDIPNTEFQRYKNALLGIIESRPNVIYATGHDHNLQLNEQGEMHHIISGSASKLNYAARGFGADYVHQQVGFARVKYYADGQSWVEFYIVNDDHPEGLLSFRKPLYALTRPDAPVSSVAEPLSDSIYTAAASSWEKRHFPASFLLGNARLADWTTPVTAPVFRPEAFAGGIRVDGKNAARYAFSLEVTGENGIAYRIRPVEKYSRRGLSLGLMNTWLEDRVDEQNRANHPYGNLIIAPLSDSLGLYTEEPRLYYLPVSPQFGQFMDEFGGSLATVEKALPDIQRDEESPYDAVLSTRNMLRRIEEDPVAAADGKVYLKERLLDFLTGNWSRDAEDWRWFARGTEKGVIIRPVSLERDQMLPEYDGLLTWFRSQKWSRERVLSFGDTINDVSAFIRGSVALDERILGEMPWTDWEEVLTDMADRVNDNTIRSAVNNLPGEIRDGSAGIIADQLVSRWNDLPEYARRYYELLNRNLSINGTSGRDEFRVRQLNHNLIHITVRSISTNLTVYDKVADPEVTNEIRLYGLAGDDRYIIDDYPVNTVIRILPGTGTDSLLSNEKEHGLFQGKIHLYGPGTLVTDTDVPVKWHRSTLFQTYWSDVANDFTGRSAPLVYMAYNPDDDLRTGLGLQMDIPGFRRSPWLFSGKLTAEYATATGAFQMDINSVFFSLFGPRNDLLFKAGIARPRVFNYFGDGNDSPNEFGVDYYRIPIESARLQVGFRKRVSDALDISLTGGYTSFNVKQPASDESIIDVFPDEKFYSADRSRFLGGGLLLELRVLDRTFNPEKGFRFSGGVNYHRQLQDDYGDFLKSHARLSLYVTPNLPLRITFASRIGIEGNTGDFYFYQSGFLGGLTNLRGYRRTRFAGKSMMYINNEIRVKLFPFRNDILNGTIGVYGFYDLGKVWNREGVTGGFRLGYGPGAYIQFMDRFIWRISYGFSREDNYLSLGTGFLF